MKNFIIFSTMQFITLNVALGFESTKVLPAGVRNVKVKTVNTSVEQKTDMVGSLHSLSEPLTKPYTLGKVLNAEKNREKKLLLKALMLNGGFGESDELARLNADVKSNISVVAPVMSYGITNKLTLAAAVPYYSAKVSRELGVVTFDAGQRLINTLHSPSYNQTEQARSVALKLNNFVGAMNAKLTSNGFEELNNWNGSGVGDTTLAAKYRFYDDSKNKFATTAGIVLPSGRTDSPDNLIDIPFGTGSYAIFSSVIADQYLSDSVFVNQYAKFTYAAPAKREIRLKTGEESIEVDKKTISYQLGSQFDLGASIQYEPQNGAVAGLGYVYLGKDSDRYDIQNNSESKSTWEGNSNQKAHYAEAVLGYSSLPAFKRGEIKVPFSVTLDYRKHLASLNSAVKDMLTLDVSVFF